MSVSPRRWIERPGRSLRRTGLPSCGCPEHDDVTLTVHDVAFPSDPSTGTPPGGRGSARTGRPRFVGSRGDAAQPRRQGGSGTSGSRSVAVLGAQIGANGELQVAHVELQLDLRVPGLQGTQQGFPEQGLLGLEVRVERTGGQVDVDHDLRQAHGLDAMLPEQPRRRVRDPFTGGFVVLQAYRIATERRSTRAYAVIVYLTCPPRRCHRRFIGRNSPSSRRSPPARASPENVRYLSGYAACFDPGRACVWPTFVGRWRGAL